MRKYPILRSGFVGLSQIGLKQPSTVSVSIVADILNKRRVEPDNDYFYHETIQDLFVKTIEGAQNGILNNFDFQEKILKAAIEAFGTKNFWDWIIFQFTDGEVTAMHCAFLVETLNYISGVPRKTQIQQWIRLLEATNDSSLIVTQGNSAYASLLELRNNKMIPADLAEVFVKWLRQPNGYYDFVCSLQVIFGNRRILAKAA